MGEADADGRPPAVSVVIPTYNRGSLLGEAVASVRAQTSPDWELIVVDDGSTDGTREIIADLSRRDDRVRLATHPRCGNPARLRNVGVGEARGRFVAFLDSDDLWEPDKLEVQRSRLEGSREFGWSYTDVSLIDERGRELPKENFEPWSPRSGRIFDDLLVHDAMIALPSVMARRSLVMDVGGFDQALDFCEDYEMWLRLARRSPVLAIDERLTRVRLHTNSHTHARAEVNRDFAEIYERMLSSHPDDATRSACRRQVAYYRAWFAVGLLRRGRYGRALGELSRAARRSPFHGEAWLVFLKQTIRALVRGSWASRA